MRDEKCIHLPRVFYYTFSTTPSYVDSCSADEGFVEDVGTLIVMSPNGLKEEQLGILVPHIVLLPMVFSWKFDIEIV